MTFKTYLEKGWIRFPRDSRVLGWLGTFAPEALKTRHNPEFERAWLHCEGTWFIGVNALNNDASGAVAGSGPMPGPALDFIRGKLGFEGGFDRAQVSIVYPGYPQPRKGESAPAFRFRQDRDGAHIDGLHPVGPDRQRKLQEFQGFLLGVPVTATNTQAAPLVVWEGSHRIIGAALRAALAQHPPETWHLLDLTEPYNAARKQVFDECKRVVVHARPGESYLLHRMAIHGVSPWLEGAKAPPEGRAILYFRPEIPRTSWLNVDL